jgi:glycosyltransferase involved in cell wall biosynthesis
MKLSIVIPTYNRSKLLIKLVRNILTFKPDWVELVIIDNASPDSKSFEDVFVTEIESKRIKYFKNQYNVEGNENILRCFEYAEGEWIWILGDDDSIYPNSFDIIEKTLIEIKNKNIFFVHHNWEKNKSYKNTIEIDNFILLFDSIHSLGDLNFISSNIIRRDSIISFSGLLHFYQLSATPIANIALFGIDRNIGSVLLSNNLIVENGFYSVENDKDDTWDVELVLSCIPVLASIPFSISNKKSIIKLINKICTIPIALKSSIRQYHKTNNRLESVFLFKEILRLKLIYGSIFIKILIEIISFMLYFSVGALTKIFLYYKK